MHEKAPLRRGFFVAMAIRPGPHRNPRQSFRRGIPPLRSGLGICSALPRQAFAEPRANPPRQSLTNRLHATQGAAPFCKGGELKGGELSWLHRESFVGADASRRIVAANSRRAPLLPPLEKGAWGDLLLLHGSTQIPAPASFTGTRAMQDAAPFAKGANFKGSERPRPYRETPAYTRRIFAPSLDSLASMFS